MVKVIDHNLEDINNRKNNTEGRRILLCFTEFIEAFDNVRREDMLNKLQENGISQERIECIKRLYCKTVKLVRNEKSARFNKLL